MTGDVEIRITPEALSLVVKIAYAILDKASVSRENLEIKQKISEVLTNIREKYSLESLKEDPIIRAYRDFFWRIGIDPTKTRPSSEALLRRVLRRKQIPSINNVVDSGNLASMITLVPIGLYDLSKIEGKLLIRMSRKGEEFQPIGSEEEELTGKELVLADERKVIHLYPHRDSEKTKIYENTRKILVVACGVPGVDLKLLMRAVNLTLEFITKFAGGVVVQKPTIRPIGA